MLNYFRSISALLLIFCLGVTLLANEQATYYFPDKLGSSWVYVDQDGNELTRDAIEEKDVEGETFRAFSYEPAIEDWEDYDWVIHPFLYQVNENWISFYVGSDIEDVIKSRVSKSMEEARDQLDQQLDQQEAANQLPPGVTIDLDYTIDPTAQDYFYLLPTPVTFNEEWVAMEYQYKLDMSLSIQTDRDTTKDQPINSSSIKVVQTGKVIGTETVETEAGNFKDCLKIEYRTFTTVKIKPPGEQSQPLLEQEANEEQEVVDSIRTLWLAPNVGIVKFKSEEKQISDEVKTLELKSYEIKSNNSKNEENK